MKTGITFSTFDLLHAGHIGMLREARSNCDYLIVGLQTDPTINRPDTKNPPVQTLVERYAQLNAHKFIDEIVPYQTEEDLVDILELFEIDVRFLGEEYQAGEKAGGKGWRWRASAEALKDDAEDLRAADGTWHVCRRVQKAVEQNLDHETCGQIAGGGHLFGEQALADRKVEAITGVQRHHADAERSHK